MKLIIDIPEDAYIGIINSGYFSSEFNMIKALKESTPLDDALGKIRTKILRYKNTIDRAITEDSSKIESMKEAYNDCLEIIDKYKAENEGT